MAPVKGSSKTRKKDAGKLWDSQDEDTSSEEDFHWLQKQCHEGGGELDDETMRLLRGVITQSYKDRKHPERYKRPLEVDYEDELAKDQEDEDRDSDIDLGKAKDNFVRPGAQYDIADLDPNEKGISREEQLRRMNILAKEFNFYAVDRPE